MLSAFVNVFGMLVATRGYTTAHLLEEQQPSVFSFPSVLLVQLWGLAFLATASRFEHNAIMCATFVAEKVRPQWRLPACVGVVSPNVFVRVVVPPGVVYVVLAELHVA